MIADGLYCTRWILLVVLQTLFWKSHRKLSSVLRVLRKGVKCTTTYLPQPTFLNSAGLAVLTHLCYWALLFIQRRITNTKLNLSFQFKALHNLLVDTNPANVGLKRQNCRLYVFSLPPCSHVYGNKALEIVTCLRYLTPIFHVAHVMVKSLKYI